MSMRVPECVTDAGAMAIDQQLMEAGPGEAANQKVTRADGHLFGLLPGLTPGLALH